MDLVRSFLAVAGGIALLAYAGDLLVRHAAAVAVRHHVPKTVVGAVVLGFGTSLPELFVSLIAALSGSSDIAIANVVGSNIANVGLILGIGALITALPVARKVTRVDLPVGLLAALFLVLVTQERPVIDRLLGAILLAAFAGYLVLTLRHTRAYRLEVPREDVQKGDSRAALWILVSLVGLAAGAQLLVWGGRNVADHFGVPERLIGLTLVAVGTSLPELAAMIAAARRSEVDLAVGNVVGSNIFNQLLVRGTTACVRTIPVNREIVAHDLPIMAVFGVLAFPFLSRGRRRGTAQGGVLCAAVAAVF
jgi:cation:H+ antiporter